MSNDPDIILIDDLTVLYRHVGSGTCIYVVGSSTENELILAAALNAVCDSLGALLRDRYDRTTLLENFELLQLTLDEIADDGVILEIDVDCIKNRVLMRVCVENARILLRQ